MLLRRRHDRHPFQTPDAPGHTLSGDLLSIVGHERHVLRISHPEEKLAAVCGRVSALRRSKNWLPFVAVATS
jgi:hypothetical protein